MTIESALGGAVQVSRDGVKIHAPQSVWRSPADGPQRLTTAKAELLMFGWHDENIRDQGQGSGCQGSTNWRSCEQFVVARIRGMHHIMFVVPMPYDPEHSVNQLYAILDLEDEGRTTLREGFDGYHTALLFAAAQCATEIATETDR